MTHSPFPDQRGNPEHYRQLRSFGVFLGWILVVVAGYGICCFKASDVPPWACHGYTECSATERNRLIFLGWFVLGPSLLIQTALGAVVNSAFSKQYWNAFMTGTITFFTTALVPLGVFAYLLSGYVSQLMSQTGA